MKIEININTEDRAKIATAVGTIASFLTAPEVDLKNMIINDKTFAEDDGTFSMSFRKPGKTAYFYMVESTLSPAVKKAPAVTPAKPKPTSKAGTTKATTKATTGTKTT